MKTSVFATQSFKSNSFVVDRNDCLYAGHRPRYLVGPLDNLDNSEQLRERLRVIASGGPQHRVGLLPNPTSRSWVFDPAAGPRSVAITESATFDVGVPADSVTDFTVDPLSARALNIHISDRWLLLDFDHGLGGGRLMTELIAAVTSDEPGFSEPLPAAGCRNPGFRAFAHTARRSPRVLAEACFRELPRRSKRPVCGEPLDRTPDIVYVRSDKEFLRRVREIRDRELPGVSVLALITSAMLRALSSLGIESDCTTGVMVDLGRHLPDGVGTLANFLGFAEVQVSQPFDAREIGDQIASYTNGCRSLVRYDLAGLVGWRHPPGMSVTRRCNDSRARLVVTDHGETRASRKIRWAGTVDERVFVRSAPVSYSNQITFATNRIGDSLHLTASFYSTEFDRDVIFAALCQVVCGTDIARIDRCDR